jgi:hypothetical protein
MLDRLSRAGFEPDRGYESIHDWCGPRVVLAEPRRKSRSQAPQVGRTSASSVESAQNWRAPNTDGECGQIVPGLSRAAGGFFLGRLLIRP